MADPPEALGAGVGIESLVTGGSKRGLGSDRRLSS